MREKTFANFKVLWLFAKVFFVKFGGVASISSTSEHSMKIVFSTNLQKFSPSNVFRYKVCTRL